MKTDVQFFTSGLHLDDNCKRKLADGDIDKDFLLALSKYISPEYISASRLGFSVFKYAKEIHENLKTITTNLTVASQAVLKGIEDTVEKYSIDHGGKDLEASLERSKTT
ncbi:hypothetical protein MXB_4131, partial [Myxobolus squamalis]